MRVLYFSQDYTVHDHRFLTKLAQSPHEIWYLRFETNPTSLETRPIPSSVKVVDWMGNKTYKLQGRSKLKLFLDFRRAVRQLQPNLIHAGPVQTCGFFVALTGFKPFLLMSWGSDVLSHPGKSMINRLITKFTISRASMITCDCAAVRDRIIELAAYSPDRIIIFPWGVDLEQFRPTPSRIKLREKLNWQHNKVVIASRSLEPLYGIEVFLKAARIIIERNPRVRFIMVGGGSLGPQVEDFIAQHDLKHAIYLAGRVSHDLLPDYFNEADLYVSSSYSDGTSVSLLEAMACGLPAVASDLPSNREWVSPGVNGELVPPGDPEALSLAITEALEQEDRARAMGEANISIARQKADWNKNFNLLLEAYGRLFREYSR